ncbi:hypothetical protein K2173_009817 [Erythroxylum novogranatense]|uniref:F-box domain-containing protein n=1 Tax=Erythroxylum novogranatense TaxID=1862640 RepID=A0AAV8SZ15_9ROSI|nr:hypothetical protein K2173_009817 [Erythroxylum novogranatense]
MSKVPFDVVSDVLHRLPVKSLVRFRSLSKPFCSLIDSRDFVNIHLRHSLSAKSHLHLLIKEWMLHSADFDSLHAADDFTHPLSSGGGTEVIGSCNGLLALRNSERDLGIYNPSTKKLKRLPVCEIDPPGSRLRTGYVFYGFGYDSVHDDYKVVRMATFVEGDEALDVFDFDYDVKVYSLKSDSWRRVKDLPFYLRFLKKPFYHVLHKRGYGVIASNSLHWTFPRRPELGVKDSILAFDLGEEMFREVGRPDSVKKEPYSQVDVGALEGNLCLMCNNEGTHIDLWIMKEYGVNESWTKMFSFVMNRKSTVLAFVRPLSYSKDGGKVLFEVNDGKFVWYDWKHRTSKTVRIKNVPHSFGSELYVESLVPVGEGDTEQRNQHEQEETQRNDGNGKKRDDFLSVGFKLKL